MPFFEGRCFFQDFFIATLPTNDHQSVYGKWWRRPHQSSLFILAQKQ
jgi:hypothetical protein